MRGAVHHSISVRLGIYPWPPAWPGKVDHVYCAAEAELRIWI